MLKRILMKSLEGLRLPGLEETFLVENFIYFLYSHNNAMLQCGLRTIPTLPKYI